MEGWKTWLPRRRANSESAWVHLNTRISTRYAFPLLVNVCPVSVFRVINDKYLEKTSEPELEHLIKAAGGDPNHCLNLFYVWSGGSGKFSSESAWL